jgi:hypothetical protein
MSEVGPFPAWLSGRPMPVGDHGGAMVAQTILNRIASKSEGIGIVALPYWWDVALMRLIRSVTNWLA